MEPYCENRPFEKLAFKDEEDDARQTFENEDMSFVVEHDPDGNISLQYMYNACYRVGGIKSAQSVLVPIRSIFVDFDDYMTRGRRCARDPETGRYGYRHNPDAKWDYYEIGGRFGGRLVTDDGNLSQAMASEIDWTLSKESLYGELLELRSEQERDGRVPVAELPSDAELRIRAGGMLCYSTLQNGVWKDKTDFKTDIDWQNHVKKIIDSLREDEVVSVVDYHI